MVVVAAGGWGWKVARGDSGFDGFVHVNESHGGCMRGRELARPGRTSCVIVGGDDAGRFIRKNVEKRKTHTVFYLIF